MEDVTKSDADYTLDGHRIVPGLRVWNYDLKRAVVIGPQAYRNPAERQWYDMETPDGKRSSMMDGGRMWVFHPSTGERA